MKQIVVTQPPGIVGGRCSKLAARRSLLFAAPLLLLLAVLSTTFAGSATWKSAPATSDWNSAGNWTAGGPPNGPADTASFVTSTRTALSISANTQVNNILFNVGASAFTITATTPLTLTISGAAITNNSGVIQKFVITDDGAGNHAFIKFTNSATAGSATLFTNNGGVVSGLTESGNTIFSNTSTAGSGTFSNNGGMVSGANGGATEFEDTSTAANGTFNNNGGAVSGAFGGFTSFSQFTNNTSTAGNGIFNNNNGAVSGANGGQTAFFATSTAANGIFINNGSAFSGAGEGFVQFQGTSTAGSGTFTNKSGTVSGANGGGIFFSGGSTAAGGTFNNNGAAVSGTLYGGFINFFNTSTAGNGTFTNNGSAVSGPGQGFTAFFDTATAGNSTFTNNGGAVTGARGGVTQFLNSSSAGAATLIANGGAGGGLGAGGTIFFQDDSSGGTAQVKVFGNGSLDVSRHHTPGVSTGSIEGSGNVFLGADNLSVGSNNLSKTFSGVIQDGGFNGGTGGSLTKIGVGTLSLTNSNPYTGGTLINAGTLIAAHDGALGSGNVRLTASGAALTLHSGATNNYISDDSTINIAKGATANLNFTGTSDRVGGIVLNGVMQTAAGTYGSLSSSATHKSSFFSGTGTLVLGTGPSTVLANISTRLRVETGSNVLIGGFIVSGTQPKKVIVRAIGPSLPVVGKLADPTLELHDAAGRTLATNDNWKTRDTGGSQQAEIQATTIPPSNDLESAIVRTLPANNASYTAVVRSKDGTAGIGLVEVYDLDRTVDSKLANISTRGLVKTGNDVMIGGFIVLGSNPQKVIARAIGPSLPLAGKLANPVLELRDRNGTLLDRNDNWRSTQQAEIIATTIPPSNDLEAAIVRTLPPGPYTAIVSGAGGTTGVALVEVYALP